MGRREKLGLVILDPGGHLAPKVWERAAEVEAMGAIYEWGGVYRPMGWYFPSEEALARGRQIAQGPPQPSGPRLRLVVSNPQPSGPPERTVTKVGGRPAYHDGTRWVFLDEGG